MSDSPIPQTEPVLKQVDGPPKPPTTTTLGLMDGGDLPPDYSPALQMVMAVTNAMMTYADLLTLNGGGCYEKRERLELSLDRNVIHLGKLAPKMRDEDLQTIHRTLRDIRGYRRRFPRQDASNGEQAEQVQRILDEITEA